MRRGHGRRRAPGHPQPGRRPHDAFDRGLHRQGRAARRPDRQAPGAHEPEEHRVRGEAPDRPQVRLAPRSSRRKRFMPYQLTNAPNGDVHIQIEDKVYSPPEISSFVLQKLKAAAEDYLGEAGRRGDHHRPRLLQRPPAPGHEGRGPDRRPQGLAHHQRADGGGARLRPQEHRKSGQFVAVYDLGGGTFDISILEMADGLFQVRATGGDTFLGGEDFDQRIIDWLIEEFLRETGIDLAARTAWRCSGSRKPPRRRSASCRRRSRRRSCCPSSRPTPRAPSTSTPCSRGRSTRS